MAPEQLEALRAALADRYQLDRELGSGGTATVFLALDRKHRRAVAIKVLHPELGTELGAERFLREIETVAGLTHPHILPLHDSGEAAGLLYYVMPYVAGETLRDRLRREGPLPLEDALRVARHVADALGFAHSQGVVHRDIKPANILLLGGYAVVADFGIARAISAAQREDGRESGDPSTSERAVTVVGTPAYMSPEQCLGAARLDGRADIYALGCVLYEMLAGRPPFEGGSLTELTAQHLADAPPPLTATGRIIPPQVAQVVRTALAKAPADRFQTTLQLVEALPEPSEFRASGAMPRLSGEAPAPRRRRPLALLAAGLAAVLAVAAFAVAPRYRELRGLDDARYVVLPFTHRGGDTPPQLDGDNCESLLYDGLSRWQDLRLVNQLRVHDAKARRGGDALDFETGLAIARELGAGRLVWGEVWETNDTVRVRAAVYDVSRRGVRLRERATAVPAAAAAGFGEVFNALADSLLVGGGRAPLAAAGAAGTDLLSAWRSYEAGHEALAAWDLEAAERGFAAAAELDGGYAQAHLWLAQVRNWLGRPAEDYRGSALAALQATRRLVPRDLAVARGYLALADGRWPVACREFDALIERDSSDFAGWFGRGDCLAGDHTVERDASSPSGWRFRTGYASALASYQQALAIIPSAHLAFRGRAFTRLADLLFTEENRFRSGAAAVGGDTLQFASFPSLANDTLAFVPYPSRELLVLARPRSALATRAAAVARGRATLGEITGAWLRAFPRSAAALEAHATALELRGVLRGARPGAAGAIDYYRRARAAAATRAQRTRLAVSETRVLLKLESWSAAADLADSLLAEPDTAPEVAARLASVAALTGRADLAAELLRHAAADFEVYGPAGVQTVPQPVAEAALTLEAYAAVGAPADSIRLLQRRAEGVVRTWIEPEAQRALFEAAFSQPTALAFPSAGRTTLHGAAAPHYLLRLQTLALERRVSELRVGLAELESFRGDRRPGGIAVDGAYQEAMLALAVGDTAHAVRSLDEVLEAVPVLTLDLLGDEPFGSVPQGAGLVRAMVLRARIAALQQDPATARRWARPVLTLWRSADPALQPVVGRLRVLGQ